MNDLQLHKKREKIEWTNTWHYLANDYTQDRWLLIGDSVTRQFRPELQKLYGDSIAIDFWGTSYCIEDELFLNDLNIFMRHDDYIYSRIIVNIGAHHGYNYNYYELQTEYANFYRAYNSLITYLEGFCDALLLCSCTPQTIPDHTEMMDEDCNKHIINRNKAIYCVAKERGHGFLDFYESSIKCGFGYVDNFHFRDNADIFFAESVKNFFEAKETKLYRWKYISDIFDFLNYISNMPVYIYGFGKRGIMLRDYIQKMGGKVLGFIVSDDQLFDRNDNDMPVLYRSDYLNLNNNDSIIIRSTIANIERINLSNYCELDENLWTFIKKSLLLDKKIL